MTHADAAFIIGKTHAVCQDYAFATSADAPIASVWLSDGCSSSPHTDIGARLLVHAMQAQHAESGQGECDSRICEAMRHGKAIAAGLDLPETALDATLLGLMETPARTLHAILYGDGALVLGRTDGTRTIYRAHYAESYPFYPNYRCDACRLAQWRNVPGNAHHVTRTVLRADGSIASERIVSLPLHAPRHLLRVPVAGLRFAAVLSDGIESFQRRAGSETAPTFASVPYLDVVRELTAFKQFTGQFVQRRLQAFEKACASRLGWHHNDDLSLAGLYFGG